MSEPGGNPPFSGEERRRTQRIHLDDRPEASFDGTRVEMMELGLLGLRISSHRPFEDGHFGELVLRYDNEDVRARCRVVRCELQARLSKAVGELVYHMGLEIADIDPGSSQSLRNLIGRRVAVALEKQRANAMGETIEWDDVIKSANARPRPAERIYTSCRLMPNETWTETTIVKPTQPRDGFTVLATATDEEIAKLKTAYEDGDDDQHNMIRVFAEMSLLDEDESLPPQRFEP